MKLNVHNFLTTSAKPCRFYQLLSGKSNSAIDTPWLRNDKYVAMVSIGALVPGWSLICPVEHSLNLSKQYSKPDFWEFVTSSVDVIRQKFGPVRLFEHGAFFENSLTSCGTGHAHLHIVPLEFSLIEESIHFAPEKHWISCFASDIQDIANGQEYLFMADACDGKGTKGLITLLDSGVSQFFRKVIASRMRIGEFYDYKSYPMTDIAEESVFHLRAHSHKIEEKVCNF